MEFQVQHKKGRVSVAGEMTVYTAAALRQDLLAALTRHRRTKLLDLSEVTEIDTAGLQLLLAARRQAADDGRELLIADPSRAVRSAIELCRLSGLLQAPDTERC
jgi:anti-sigma B factor antagonist